MAQLNEPSSGCQVVRDCRMQVLFSDLRYNGALMYYSNLEIRSTNSMAKQSEPGKINRQTARLPDYLSSAVQATLEDWRVNDKVRRLWEGDATLWTGADESNWLGWLRITGDQLAHLDHLTSVAEDVKNARFSHALLLGMGGSSLCPEVMRLTFGKIAEFPELHVLDSTDPAQVKTRAKEIEL